MIFKAREAADQRVLDLEEELRLCAGEQRKRLERDLAQARAGLKGEQEAAYHIDFHLKDSKNWAIIHDLRIEWNGRAAQMDHVLINRLMEIYVIESKSFRTKVRFANGGWERLAFNHWEGIPSPVEQNDRHIIVLKELLGDRQLAPMRFGLAPTLINVVAVQPSCSVVGAIPSNARVYRMDVLVNKLVNETPSAFQVLKAVSQQTLHTFAQALVSCHLPLPRRPVEKLVHQERSPSGTASAQPGGCDDCNGPISPAEIRYCSSKKQVFAGRKLCRKCQGYVPATLGQIPSPRSTEPASTQTAAGRCAVCAADVDSKVVAFCRFNSRKFGRRILCRSCQLRPIEIPGENLGAAA